MPTAGKKAALLNQIMVLMDLEVVVPEVKETAPVMEDPYSPIATEVDVDSQEFSSNRRDLSFILGSEGDALRKLEREKHVRISINIGENTYTIRGTKESIEEAKAAIQEMVAVIEESWDISGYADRESVTKRPSALEEIALGSKTFVSAGENDTLVISGRSQQDMEEAKRLFDLKMQKKDKAAESLTFLNQEDDQKPLGMFPVFDTVTMSSGKNQASYFRISQAEPVSANTYCHCMLLYDIGDRTNNMPCPSNSLRKKRRRRPAITSLSQFGHRQPLLKNSRLSDNIFRKHWQVNMGRAWIWQPTLGRFCSATAALR